MDDLGEYLMKTEGNK